MTKQLESLRKKRKIIQSKLTNFKNFVDSKKDLEIIPIPELELRLNKVDNLLNEFEFVQDEIDCISNNITDEEKIRKEFEDNFYSVISFAKSIVTKYHSDSDSVISNNSNNSPINNVKLPTIELPKFSGDFRNWLDFHDSFDSMIIKNQSLNEIQKFHYLKAAVSGNAANVISSLPVSNDNFILAWKLICERYENKRLLIHSHIKAIFDLPKLNKESWQNLRQLTDGVSSNLRSLKSLGEPTEHWDSLINFIIINKLDSNSERDWESLKNESHKLNELLTFLTDRASVLESRSFKNSGNECNSKKQTKSFVSTQIKCQFCHNSHKIVNCSEFLKLNIKQRGEEVKRLKLCLNCLHSGHMSRGCVYGKCQKCSMKHHTLLHIDNKSQISSSTPQAPIEAHEAPITSLTSNFADNQILLSTVSVQVQDLHGNLHMCKAVLDSGSQSNFISEELCQRLGIEKQNIDLAVSGIGQVNSFINFKCSVKLEAVHAKFSLSIPCLVVREICNLLPSHQVDITSLQIPSNLRLADPTFHTPSKIDILIGSSCFWEILSVGQIRLGNSMPILQKTRFGWIVSGPLPLSYSYITQCNFSQNALSENLSKFWEIEENFNSKVLYSDEEKRCEEHFISTYQRNHDGRFVVSIPLKTPPDMLGDSQHGASKRFYNMERRLLSNPSLKNDYFEFIKEYISLGHMSKSPDGNISDISYFLPHHAVMKEQSLTTKLRVVFDGSFPSSSGLSVNDLQMVGPNIQSDLLSILLRFRQHTFVVSADIVKMYRQVLVNPSQRNLQQILWRFNNSHELESYQLNTITYGTSAASFLATRCLLQLSKDFANDYPEASRIIASDFYVDDLLTGSDSASCLSRLCVEIQNILQTGCFPLRKWVSNNVNIVQSLSSCTNDSNFLQIGESTKTLGLFWCYDADVLFYKITPPVSNSSTKRSILSNIAQIFDPLGLLAPCVVKIKILIQRIWSEQLDWDQSVPLSIHTEWLRFKDQLSSLNDLRISRHFKCIDAGHLELHGFCDSSEQAYGACIYVRSIDAFGNITVNLLCAKSKVAPLKRITLPRLELCGALILSRLVKKVLQSLSINFNEIFFWSDSTIVLGWIRTSPNLLKTFVGNRVSEITSNTDPSKWFHVGSKENPADLLTRGLDPSLLISSNMWWKGPDFLSSEPFVLPFQPDNLNSKEIPEMKQIRQSLLSFTRFDFPFERFSSLTRLKRSMAYCLRFVHNIRTSNSPSKLSGIISLQEIRRAEQVLIKIVQNQEFRSEVEALKSKRQLKSNSKLISLHPFLDSEGLLRVGGRLRKSSFDWDKVHPLLLPSKHLLTRLILQDIHLSSGHCGPQQLLYLVRERFWPIHGRNAAKKVVHDCITCFKAKPFSQNPLMADLPKYRTEPSFPFLVTGVDYSGPFLLKDRKGRGCKTYKCYVSVFVCLSSKAIHLEVVSDLSTPTFISALKRFISRRGKPAQVFSDNGTNFVGASNELKYLQEFLNSHQDDIIDQCNNEGIEWKFIPSYSPHFGGIWEAGVKSMKFHLKRILKNSLLTYEDFQTILIQIEGILNSRPLSPLSNDPSDLNPLTPSHLLLGRPLHSVPEVDYTRTPENRLATHQRLQSLRQHFWKRWSIEFISELQQRQKWKTNKSNIQLGTMVLVKDKQLPPLNWLLGRVEKLHPGSDGITRVVSVKTSRGVLRRSVTGICPLPIDHEVK